jgi:hypothetical protein
VGDEHHNSAKMDCRDTLARLRRKFWEATVYTSIEMCIRDTPNGGWNGCMPF